MYLSFPIFIQTTKYFYDNQYFHSNKPRNCVWSSFWSAHVFVRTSYKKVGIDVGLWIEKIPSLLLFSTAFSHNSIFGFQTSFLLFFIEEKTKRVSHYKYTYRKKHDKLALSCWYVQLRSIEVWSTETKKRWRWSIFSTMKNTKSVSKVNESRTVIFFVVRFPSYSNGSFHFANFFEDEKLPLI